MSKVHALQADTSGNYRVVIHTPMPGGNNLVGNSWKNIALAAGVAQTSMQEGAGIGQISTAEKADVENGDVLEISAVIPIEVVDQGAVAVDAFADNLIASAQTRMQQIYVYYGWTNG